MTIVSLSEIIIAAKTGKVVSFPTDTVPALAVQPEQSPLIFALKKRPANKPLILMAASAVDVWDYVRGTKEELATWQEIGEKYWPGALTLVLPTVADVAKTMNSQYPSTIGVRVPNFPLAREILRQTGALATTSANLSGESPLENIQEIARVFPQVLCVDCGEDNDKVLGSSLPSTVAKWTGNGWIILREGSVKLIDN